jgi:hypothetical protein
MGDKASPPRLLELFVGGTATIMEKVDYVEGEP